MDASWQRSLGTFPLSLHPDPLSLYILYFFLFAKIYILAPFRSTYFDKIKTTLHLSLSIGDKLELERFFWFFFTLQSHELSIKYFVDCKIYCYNILEGIYHAIWRRKKLSNVIRTADLVFCRVKTHCNTILWAIPYQYY